MSAPLDVLATPNPFRNKPARAAFNDLVKAYNDKSPLLFQNGEPHRGNSWADMFWRGFDGANGVGVWDRASKQTNAYPCYVAGQRVRAALAKFGGAA